jgi:hypothetical protein
MKTNIKNIFFGVVLLGNYPMCYAAVPATGGEEFASLKERSPFGDTPKPEPKPQKQAVAPAAPPPAPKKPEMKLSFTGWLRMGEKNYYAICDKTSKEAIHTVLIDEIPSPLGYFPERFDPNRRIINIEFNGHDYTCQMGADEKKSTTTTSISSGSAYSAGGGGGSGGYGDYGGGGGGSNYDWDNWGDWNEGGYDDYGYGDYYGGGGGYDDYGYGGYDDYYGGGGGWDDYGDYGGYDDYGYGDYGGGWDQW